MDNKEFTFSYENGRPVLTRTTSIEESGVETTVQVFFRGSFVDGRPIFSGRLLDSSKKIHGLIIDSPKIPDIISKLSISEHFLQDKIFNKAV